MTGRRSWARSSESCGCSRSGNFTRRPHASGRVSHRGPQALPVTSLRGGAPGLIRIQRRRQYPASTWQGETDAGRQTPYVRRDQALYDPRRRQAIERSHTQRLRSGRPMRRPKLARRPTGLGITRGMVSITARPAEVEDRKIPGHWKGNLVMGTRPLAVATLVERTSRYTTVIAPPDGMNPSRSPRTSHGASSTAIPPEGRGPPHVQRGAGRQRTRAQSPPAQDPRLPHSGGDLRWPPEQR